MSKHFKGRFAMENENNTNITQRTATVYTTKCVHCGRVYEDEDKGHVISMAEYHKKSCSYDPANEGCGTCMLARLSLYSNMGIEGCRKGIVKSYTDKVHCAERIPGTPSKFAIRPALNKEVVMERWGIHLPAGTRLEYHEGNYFLERLPKEAKDWSCYKTDMQNYAFKKEDVHWIGETE